MCKDFGKAVMHYSNYIPQLREVTNMLSRKWSQGHLIGTCFAELPPSVFAADVLGFHARPFLRAMGLHR
eukprot:2315142-Prorocentrum_lima.AAC.1